MYSIPESPKQIYTAPFDTQLLANVMAGSLAPSERFERALTVMLLLVECWVNMSLQRSP